MRGGERAPAVVQQCSGGIFGILDEDIVYFCGLEIFTEGSFPELVKLQNLEGGEKRGLLKTF